MDYVQNFNLFGVDVRQLPCIPGKGAPTSKTEGSVGDMYMDTNTGTMYKCIRCDEGLPTWEEIRSDTSVKQIADAVCPAFTESGAVVNCRPVTGYPLEVVSNIETQATEAILYMSGKNLLDITAFTNENKERVDSLKKETNAITITTSSQGRSQWGGRFIVPQVLWGKTLTFSFGEWSNTDATANPMFFIQVFNADGSLGTYSVYPQKGNTITFPVEDATYLMMYFRVGQDAPYSPAGTVLTVKDIQLEIGDEATAYQPFAEGRFFTAEFGRTVTGGVYDWSSGVLTDESGETVQLTPYKLAALPGGNILYSDTGDTTVTGRADPSAVIDKLETRIAALEAVIVHNT